MRPHRQQPTRLPRPWDSPGKSTGLGCHFLLQCRKVKSESEVYQSCLILSDPIDCSVPGSSVHGIFQARVLEWVSIAFFVIIASYIYIYIWICVMKLVYMGCQSDMNINRDIDERWRSEYYSIKSIFLSFLILMEHVQNYNKN